MAEFALHPQLTVDCIPVGNLPLCRILLMNNAHFPWLILVPQRDNARELFDLNEADYRMLMEEIRLVASVWSSITLAHKINIAALGNIVPQLHIHIIARFTADIAWPSPVWNNPTPAQAYDSDKALSIITALKQRLVHLV